jgi:glycosyl transferase family 25
MIPVFLINLDRSSDRLATMQLRGDAIGLAFNRIQAIDGANVPGWLAPQFLDSPMSPGEIGCYASHLTVHQRIVDDGLPHALILEDDVRLEPDVLTAAAEAIAAAPADWDCIHLSARWKRPVYPIAHLPGGRRLVRFIRVPLNAGGYLISRARSREDAGPRTAHNAERQRCSIRLPTRPRRDRRPSLSHYSQ